MSCFIVDIDVYNKLAGIADCIQSQKHNSVLFPLVTLQRYSKIDLTAKNVKRLLFLNILAYDDKYKHHGENNLDLLKQFKPDFIDRDKIIDMPEGFFIQVLKNLQCIKYQCCEAAVLDNPVREKFINKLNKFISHLSLCIIENSKYYDRANWGEF